MLDNVIRVAAFIVGLLFVVQAVLSAIRFFVVPRSEPDRIARLVFLVVRRCFDMRLRRVDEFTERDRILAFFAPLALVSMPFVSLTIVALGYSIMFWAVDREPWREDVQFSGSSLLTLGFKTHPGYLPTLMAFSEAAIGLILVTLLIAYLPTMYSAFSRREQTVSLLAVRAGSPPSATEMIIRSHRIEQMQLLSETWVTWEQWFVELDETHTSLPALAFYRSPRPQQSWVTAAGVVLDCASLLSAAIDVPRDPRRELCIRAGYLALRRIAEQFDVSFDANPKPGDWVSIERSEFDEALAQLAAEGVALKADRDQSWLDFAGWRINYDVVLLSLAALVEAPFARWSSDRMPIERPRPRVIGGNAR